MITPQQWHSLLYLTPSFFKYPDRMAFAVVAGLDRLIQLVGSMPVWLDDYRFHSDNPDSQHLTGRAIDVTWPDRDPLEVWDIVQKARIFSGLGLYANEQDVASFHFDTRPDRTVTKPALWGGRISHPFNPDTGAPVKQIDYVGAGVILEQLKKKFPGLILCLIGFGLWLYRKLKTNM
jgi:hypothetical protein